MHLHHIQVSMPRGGEDEARRFYSIALGLDEVAKPPSLAARGGCWFRAPGDAASVEIHLGVEEPFTPAGKAHPAIAVDSILALEAVADRIQRAGYEVSWSERTTFEGYERFHCRDGFGNRLEILAAAGGGGHLVARAALEPGPRAASTSLRVAADCSQAPTRLKGDHPEYGTPPALRDVSVS